MFRYGKKGPLSLTSTPCSTVNPFKLGLGFSLQPPLLLFFFSSSLSPFGSVTARCAVCVKPAQGVARAWRKRGVSRTQRNSRKVLTQRDRTFEKLVQKSPTRKDGVHYNVAGKRTVGAGERATPRAAPVFIYAIKLKRKEERGGEGALNVIIHRATNPTEGR